MPNWPEYIKLTENKLPRPLLVEALEYVHHRYSALDLGAGALNDSKYLLSVGFSKVVAIDSEEVPLFSHPAFIFKKVSIEDYDFPSDTFYLVNAQFVLPFIKKDKLRHAIAGIKKSLKDEGLFTGQFFGTNDDWNKLPSVSIFSKEEVLDMLSDFEKIVIREEEKEAPTASGSLKHWHIFHFIVKNNN
jgi:SAM-dependent methyltransferase